MFFFFSAFLVAIFSRLHYCSKERKKFFTLLFNEKKEKRKTSTDKNWFIWIIKKVQLLKVFLLFSAVEHKTAENLRAERHKNVVYVKIMNPSWLLSLLFTPFLPFFLSAVTKNHLRIFHRWNEKGKNKQQTKGNKPKNYNWKLKYLLCLPRCHG